MAGEDDRRDATRELSAAWELVGQFLENSSALGQRMAARNLELWKGVAKKLDKGTYTTDDVVTDTAKAFLVATRTMNDLWTTTTNPPERERVAGNVPTAFLFFDRREGQVHALLDPTLIRVAVREGDELPEEAQIALSGTDEAGADALRRSLRARLHPEHPATYALETVDSTVGLLAGQYDGFVYIIGPDAADARRARPLANLRIVVEGPPGEGQAAV